MCERKVWSSEQDQLIQKLVGENQLLEDAKKNKWTEIANKLNKKMIGSKRTGKQCRERWHNHIDPNIKGSEFSQQEISRLFDLHDTLGNKWAAIAKQLPGRTDNCIKNFFYASFRRALKHINAYVSAFKKKFNIKPFQSTILTKIMKIQNERQMDTLDIRTTQALQLAVKVKNMLLKLSLEAVNTDLTEDQRQFRQQLVKQIQNFNRCCKKRKQKKHSCEQSDEQIIVDRSQKKKAKPSRKKVNGSSQPKHLVDNSKKSTLKKSIKSYKTKTQKVQKKIKKIQHFEVHQTPNINISIMNMMNMNLHSEVYKNPRMQKDEMEISNQEAAKKKTLQYLNFGEVNFQKLVMEHEMQSPPFVKKPTSKLSRRDSRESASHRQFDFRNTFDMFNQPNIFDSNGLFLLRKQSNQENNGVLNRSDCFENNSILSKSSCLDQGINPTMFASINVQDELKKINNELVESSFFKET